MGLVTCSKCRKIYDYDKYNGICPKCARYNKETSAAQDHQEYHDRYDGGYSHTAQDAHHSYHQKYDDNKNPHGSQLDSVKMTLRDVVGAEHKVNLEAKASRIRKMDKKSKAILSIIFGIIALNIVFSGGLLLLPIILGVVIYFSKKKK